MITPGTTVPNLDLPLTIGARYNLEKQTPDQFTLLVFYRGKHCPICRKQLEELATLLDDFTEAGVNVAAISMDSKERAMEVDGEWKTGDVPLAYDLSEEDAREWGLYVSDGRPDTDEPDVFSEPALFLVRPEGSLYFASVQNAPFSRPPFDQILDGIKHVVKTDYPVRGART